VDKDFENLIRKIVKEEKVPGLSVTNKAQSGSKKETDAYYKDVSKKMGDYDRNLKQDDDFTPPKRDLTNDEQEFHDEVEMGRGMEHLRYDNEPNEEFKKRQEDAIKGSMKMGNKTENGDKDPVWNGSVEDFGEKLIDRIKKFAKKEEDATQTYVQFGDDIELSDKEPMIKKKKMAVESVNEAESVSNMELYKDRRKQGDSPKEAALFLLDIITHGTYVSKSEDEIEDYVNQIVDIYEKNGNVNEETIKENIQDEILSYFEYSPDNNQMTYDDLHKEHFSKNEKTNNEIFNFKVHLQKLVDKGILKKWVNTGDMLNPTYEIASNLTESEENDNDFKLVGFTIEGKYSNDDDFYEYLKSKDELLNSIDSLNKNKDEFDLSTFKVYKHYESYDDEKFVEVPFKNRKDSDLNESEDDEKWVVVSLNDKKDGFLVSKPSTKEKAEEYKKLTTPARGEQLKVITVDDAKKIKTLVGKEDLTESCDNKIEEDSTEELVNPYGGKLEEIKSEIEGVERDGETPTVTVNKYGLISVSAEDGKSFAEYYGSESNPWPHIDDNLEDIAEKHNSYWEWENPGSIMLAPTNLNESKDKPKDSAYDKFFTQKMNEFGVDSPNDLSKEQWNEIDKQWLAKDEKIKITGGHDDFKNKTGKKVKDYQNDSIIIDVDGEKVVVQKGDYEVMNESITNNKKPNIKQKNKMKRLKFKREFKSVEDVLNLIPENYKVDDKTFIMTDGNQNLKVRWEGDSKEGNPSILEMTDDKYLKESVDKMFYLMDYNPADAQSKSNDPESLNENEIFSKLFSETKNGVLTESESEKDGEISETKLPEDLDMYEKIKEVMGVESLCDAIIYAMDSDTFKEIMEYIVRTQEITLDEGIGDWLKRKAGLKDDPKEVEARKEKLLGYLSKAKEKGWENFQYDGEKVDEDTLISKMEKNGFSGKFIAVPKKGVLVYKPGAYGAGRLGSGGSSQGLGV